MKTLSVKQPWATLLCFGIKDIENRTWSTNYRGKLLIHASQKWDCRSEELYSIFSHEQWCAIPREVLLRLANRDIPCGAIVGKVNLRDIVTDSSSIWAEPGLKHWKCTDGELFKPIPAKGSLGLWEFKEDD